MIDPRQGDSGSTAATACRTTLSLDGVWRVAESVGPEERPTTFGHTVPVPGLIDLATPPFPDAGRYQSREMLWKRVWHDMLSEEEARAAGLGISRQERGYFWYRRGFTVPERRESAILRIGKAAYGTAVWLNGSYIDEYLPTTTAGFFNLTEAMNWEGENELLVRVGAYPGVLPPEVPVGTDNEKARWMPGIYDRLTLALADNPLIEWVQVAPAIDPPAIQIQTRVTNTGSARWTFAIQHQVRIWQGGEAVAIGESPPLVVEPGQTIEHVDLVPIPNGRLWSPDDPFLYVVETSTGGDSLSTRFGLREFRFDTATKRAYLNGKLIFLRGSNIGFNRFLDDPRRGGLPWDEQWVRKLLGEIPRRMHWNSFRCTLGPVPELWLEVADEAGLLLQHEFFLWYYRPEWDLELLRGQYRDYVRDAWNHPSVAVFDAGNEVVYLDVEQGGKEIQTDILSEEVIPAVRSLDLSKRPWDASYGFPVHPNDPVEIHPYEFLTREGAWVSKMEDLEKLTGANRGTDAHPTAHATVINEYGLLWLKRDGTPTHLTETIWEKLAGADATPETRLELNAYLLAGLTEFWRAHRNHAGVLHFTYLTHDDPDGWTGDHFRDIERLELHPWFEEYVGNAFKPLGVYVNFWQPALAAGSPQVVSVMLVNDEESPAIGSVSLTLETRQTGMKVFRLERRFELPGYGAHTYRFRFDVPRWDEATPCLLKATALRDHDDPSSATISRRTVRLVPK